ncbi:phenoloxidase 3-like [Drosophila rhopaloa]|uniref:Phenoloxidase 3-like n=1 Tax=Drosophila rhopaloa TaxID=1041015 RepID=A0A6P4F1Y7_DRORH|nr:phenoloxidase 3-like [Drosophila rhopaloa]
MVNKKDLLLLFDHPTEPVFMDKGGNGTVFEMPDSFLTERYSRVSKNVQTRVSGEGKPKIFVKDITIPDLSFPESLKRNQSFSLFVKSHRQMAGYLIEVFTKLPSVDDLLSVAVYARDRVHPVLFHYALSVALLHRPDTQGLDLPSFWQAFPGRFVDSAVMQELREESFVVQSPGDRRPMVIPTKYTSSDLDPEQRMWYFREDIGVNLHHWHWHLVYPTETSPGADRRIVEKDRRGELFYYMHQQLIVRYNAERLSNYMASVQPLNNLDETIAEGYFPKMDSLVASRAYPPRSDNTRLSDVNRPTERLRVGIDEMKRWRERIYQAIHQRFVIDTNNKRIPLDEVNGIDILGNMIEANALSPNQMLYGNFHNMGHVLIAFSHDPTNKHLEPAGVMGYVSTSMRDPVFYKWHALIDDIFQEHKKILPAYKAEDLSFRDIDVSSIQVESRGQKNRLTTYFKESDLDLSRGMDFQPRGNVYARFTHLQHHPFQYNIVVNNFSGVQRYGYVRIFMAPKFDDTGLPMVFANQRLMMMELDKFVVMLPPGQNTFTRNSTDSSVTIPFERTFRNLDSNRGARNSPEEQENYFCGCGWPNHMLVPMGRAEGMSFDLFVMVSNYENDRVDQPRMDGCSDAASYCGIRDRLYPDRKAMGYPFDRVPRATATTLNQFLTSNMQTVEITITHDSTIDRLPALTN